VSEAILVTSIGAKLPLLRVLKRARDSFDKNIQIIGADVDAKAEARKNVEAFWQMPPLETLTLELLLEYAKEHQIRYIIPTRDAELLFFAQHKSAFQAHGIAVFVADEPSVAFCYDKLYFYQQDKSNWAIPTYLDINAVQMQQVVLKERFGAGAKNILINAAKEKAKNRAKELQNPIFQPFIEGQEYSIDCYVDRNGVCRGVILRSRDVVVSGESQITTRVKDRELEAKAATFVELHRLQGHSVLQVIKNSQGTHLIECNARFGGASTLSEYLGLKSFLWFFYEANEMVFDVEISQKIIRQTREGREDSYSEC